MSLQLASSRTPVLPALTQGSHSTIQIADIIFLFFSCNKFGKTVTKTDVHGHVNI